MKNLKKIIIILSVLIVVLILAIIIFLVSKNKNSNQVASIKNEIQVNQNVQNSTNGIQTNQSGQKNVKVVNNVNEFYTISKCIQVYLNNKTENNYEVIKNLLYSANTDININSEKYITFTPLKINVVEGTNTNVYAVYGKILEEGKIGLGENLYSIVRVCKNNKTFSIEPLNNNFNSIDEINLDSFNSDKEIKENENNRYIEVSVTNERIIKDYFNYFINCLLYDRQEAYNLLDNEYKQKKFGNYANFENYLNENEADINRTIMSKYSTAKGNERKYYKYRAIDNFENEYIFKEKSVMDFSVLMDDYTIQINKEDYLKYTNEEKAKECAIKFFKIIKSKNYEYAYEKMDNNYRQKNTIEQFKQYIYNNFYGKNSLDINKVISVGQDNMYIVDLSIYNTDNKDERSDKTLIVALKEETDYTISFNE